MHAQLRPQIELVRRHLQSFTAAAIASNWRSEAAPAGVSFPDVSKMSREGARSVLTDLINRIGLEIRQLNPPDQLHEKLAADCFDQFKDVVRARWSIIEEPYSSIARPFLRMLVFWLMVIFVCFGLRAPASPIVLIVIALSAISGVRAVPENASLRPACERHQDALARSPRRFF